MQQTTEITEQQNRIRTKLHGIYFSTYSLCALTHTYVHTLTYSSRALTRTPLSHAHGPPLGWCLGGWMGPSISVVLPIPIPVRPHTRKEMICMFTAYIHCLRQDAHAHAHAHRTCMFVHRDAFNAWASSFRFVRRTVQLLQDPYRSSSLFNMYPYYPLLLLLSNRWSIACIATVQLSNGV